jgi:hypothetical protein
VVVDGGGTCTLFSWSSWAWVRAAPTTANNPQAIRDPHRIHLRRLAAVVSSPRSS